MRCIVPDCDHSSSRAGSQETTFHHLSSVAAFGRRGFVCRNHYIAAGLALATQQIKQELNAENPDQDGVPKVEAGDDSDILADDIKQERDDGTATGDVDRRNSFTSPKNSNLLSDNITIDDSEDDNAENATADKHNVTAGSGLIEGSKSRGTHPSKTLLSCELCPYQTVHEYIFLSHLKAHGRGNSYDCPHCHYKTSYRLRLESHIATHTGDKPFSCQLCTAKFAQQSRLVDHIRTHSDENPFECRVCKKSFGNSNHYKRHVLTHTGEKPFSCDICDRKFTRKCHVLRHQLTHGDKQFSCDICDKQFLRPDYLQRHVMLHTDSKQYTCDLCDKNFAIKEHLRNHVVSHYSGKSLRCCICKKKFKNRDSLRKHLNKCPASEDRKKFCCDICKKVLSKKHNMIIHLRLHYGKPYKCEQCNTAYANKGNLCIHFKRKHPEEYKIRRRVLKRESRKIEKNDKFCCDICKKVLSTRETMICHLRLHYGKPYTCNICNRSYANKWNLKVHNMRKHTKKIKSSAKFKHA